MLDSRKSLTSTSFDMFFKRLACPLPVMPIWACNVNFWVQRVRRAFRLTVEDKNARFVTYEFVFLSSKLFLCLNLFDACPIAPCKEVPSTVD